jgi:predicted transposase/invertase (TIGR01784 family)
MGEKGDEVQLLSFLNALLCPDGENPFTSVEIIENTTVNPKVLGDKKSVLDVRAKLSDGIKANIEVQLRNFGDMAERSLFYWSRDFAAALTQGDNYNTLPKIISINIVNFKYIRLADFHTSYHIREDTHTDYMLTDRLEIHFIDMVEYRRLKAVNVEKNGLHRWLTFFDSKAPDELREQVVSMDTAIQRAHDKIAEALRDKEAVYAYEMVEKAEHDYASGIAYNRRLHEEAEKRGLEKGMQKGLKKGMQEGMQQGERQAKLESARNFRSLGVSDEIIAQATGLALEEIAEL